jgi:chitin disaccharide deacetylase
MKQLIVNADDFAMTPGINRAIVECHQHGILTSTTIIANGDAFEDAVQKALALPSLALGVHLNLSQGKPAAPPAQVASLVNSRGELFLKPPRLLHRLASKKVRPVHIERELRAQIQRVFDAGLSPDHLDGHLHTHVVPGVREIVIRLAHEFKIPAVRCPMERTRKTGPGAGHSSRPHQNLRAQLGRATRHVVTDGISFFARRFAKLLDAAGLQHPHHFAGNIYVGAFDLEAMHVVLDSLDEGLTELMCHPGYVDAALASTGGSLQAQREAEVDALTSPETRERIADLGIQLTSYAVAFELAKPRENGSATSSSARK